jgi:hypothetical protein
MSLIHRRSRLLSLAPKVLAGNGWLRASTHGFWVALSLFSYKRELHVDAKRELITLKERWCWQTTENRVSFAVIDHIEYGFGDWATSFFTAVQSGRYALRGADSVERFYVALVLKTGQSLPLFVFVGDGERMTGLAGVLMGDGIVDFSGEQESESLLFVKQLQQLTRLQLGPALPGNLERRGQKCSSCGHANAARARCLYCGAQLAAVERS